MVKAARASERSTSLRRLEICALHLHSMLCCVHWTFLSPPSCIMHQVKDLIKVRERNYNALDNDQTNQILHDGGVKFFLTKLKRFSPMFAKYKGDFLSVTPSAVLAKYLHCLTSQVYKTSSQRWFYQAGCQVGLSVVPSYHPKSRRTEPVSPGFLIRYSNTADVDSQSYDSQRN